MMRSARYSRSFGLTAHLCAVQPPPAPTRSARRIAFLENNRQSTGILLRILNVVGIEDHVIAKIESQRDALLEGHHHAAADVHRREIADPDRELVGLLARADAASSQREKGSDRRG